MTEEVTGIAVYRGTKLTRRITSAAMCGLAVLLLLTLATPAGAQGLPTKSCPVSGGGTVQAYLCLDDIVVVDGAGNPNTKGGLYLVDPTSGNQTPISTGGFLIQAASVTLEPGSGKILASTRTFGVIRVDPKDGSQEVILKGGTGWGKPFPTFSDSANNNATECFISPAGITIDPMDSSILVSDTCINLFTTTLSGNPNCTDPNNVLTCESFPGKIIRIKKGQGAGVYAGTALVAKGGLLSDPFDIAVDGGSSLYVTDMNAVLGGANDPGKGGIIYLNASQNYSQSAFFSSYAQNPNAPTYGCPMGITVNGAGTIFATVFSYNGFGCAPQAVFGLTPGAGTNPPTLSTVFSGYPLQFPFGMDIDRSGRILIADEGSGYSCKGTIFRLDLTKPIVTQFDGNLNDFNPFALSPIVGAGCSPPNQTNLVTPSDVAVVKVAVSANIAVPPSNVSVSMSPATINEGGTSSISSSFTDSSTSATHTVTITWGDGSANTVLNRAAGVLTIPATAHQYVDNNSPSNVPFTVSVSVANVTGTATGTTSMTVNNVAPRITGLSGPSGSVKIGDPVTIVASFNDPGILDTFVCAVAWGDGQSTAGSVSATNGSGSCTGVHPYSASGVFTVGVVVTDKDGGAGSSPSFQVRVNTPPVISSITGPTTALIAGSAATIKANFTDVDTADTHTCALTWGDGQTSAGSVTETSGSGSCQATHTYVNAGVFTVGVTVSDNPGQSATKTFQYVVIFDPTEGSIHGTGSFNSPAGALSYDPSAAGSASFGFSVAYAKGAIVPTGYKQFDYTDGNIHFYSETINWLVISGATAQFQGNTDVNGDGRVWTFLVTVTDGKLAGGGGVDRFRLKLIDDTGLIAYDNVRGAPDDLSLTSQQQIASGDIVVFLNTPPTVSSLTLDQTTINEAGTVNLAGTFTDPDAGQSHTVTVDWGDGTAGTTVSVSATSSNFAVSHKYKDNPTGTPSFTITARVFDTFNAVGDGTTSVTVNNVPPLITTVTGPTTTVSTGANATVKVNFTDVGVLDTHTCAYAWSDGQTSSGTVTETNGSGSCTASHIYTATGSQTVTITVTDKDGGSVSSTFSVLVNTPPAVSTVSLSATAIHEGGQSTLPWSFHD